jgi:predicted ATP-grasp superfamily ATP-dependent carboligase
VQGVSGLNDAYFVGVTRQETDLNGKYVRGLLPNNDKSRKNASIAALTGMKVIRAAQLQGYRGFAGVDVILAEMTDGSLISFVLEMNARLNSSTSLLSLSHFVAAEKKAPFICAENFNIKLKNSMNINEFLFHYDDLLYKAEESNFNGLIPIILHPNTNGDFEIKTVLVASDNDKLSELNSKLLAFNSNYVINK